jgi:hypothetical protein
MVNEHPFIGKRLKVYAHGGFAVGKCVDAPEFSQPDWLILVTDKGDTVYVYSPGLIFVEQAGIPFPPLNLDA